MSVIRNYKSGIIIQNEIKQGVTNTPGSAFSSISNTLEKFNILTKQWEEKTGMKSPRCGFALVSDNDYLLAIGGTNGAIFLKTVEEYDTISDEWSDKASMSEGKAFFQYCKHNEFIYIIGGFNLDARGNLSFSNKVERYNTISNTWEILESTGDNKIAFGTAHYYNNKIFVINGYLNEIGVLNNKILIYDINTNLWSESTVSNENLTLYKRLIPFFFIKENYLYVYGGIYNEINNDTEVELTINYICEDSFRINLSTNEIQRSDKFFIDLPKGRYGGVSVYNLTETYSIGGINKNTNTIKNIDLIDFTDNLFYYEKYSKLLKGRSAFGACLSEDNTYSTDIYVSGGIRSRQKDNYLYVILNSLPKTVNLDGLQTAGVDILCVDENGDYPEEEVKVLLEGDSGFTNKTVIFSKDQVQTLNGMSYVTLLPRSEENEGSTNISDSFSNSYNIEIKGKVISDIYQGETDPIPSDFEIPNGGTSSNNNTNNKPPFVGLPDDVKLLFKYSSVISKEQQGNSVVFGTLLNIGDIVNLVPFVSFGSNVDTNVNYYNDQKWLPIVYSYFENNSTKAEEVIAYLDEMKEDISWGGSPMLDCIEKSIDILEFDENLLLKNIYIASDGAENSSRFTSDNIIERIDSVTGNKRFPINVNLFNIVPSEMVLDKGVKESLNTVTSLTNQTDGNINEVISDNNIDEDVRKMIISQGFLGYGSFSCEIDMSEVSRIEDIRLQFNIQDIDTSANWIYSTASEDRIFSVLSTLKDSDHIEIPNKLDCRYIKFFVVFNANMIIDSYSEEKIIPPVLESIIINYHKKTTSYIYLSEDTSKDNIHNLCLSFNLINKDNNEFNIGFTSSNSKNWEDFGSDSKPFVENNEKIVVPIRKELDPREIYSLEPLDSVDGFLYKTRYGKWDENADVKIYNSSADLIDSSLYRAFSKEGYVLFNEKKVESFIISISNKNNINIAIQVINRIRGNPIIINDGGYFYSSLKPKRSNSYLSKILPEAINLSIVPLNPNVNSIFRAFWSFYDLRSRQEKNSIVKWFINNVEAKDIYNLKEWDNKEWDLIKAGDTVYFSITPKSSDNVIGKTVKSIFVKVI